MRPPSTSLRSNTMDILLGTVSGLRDLDSLGLDWTAQAAAAGGLGGARAPGVQVCKKGRAALALRLLVRAGASGRSAPLQTTDRLHTCTKSCVVRVYVCERGAQRTPLFNSWSTPLKHPEPLLFLPCSQQRNRHCN